VRWLSGTRKANDIRDGQVTGLDLGAHMREPENYYLGNLAFIAVQRNTSGLL